MSDKLCEVLDLIEAGRLHLLRRFVRTYKFNLNQIGTESGIAAIHYASGLEDESRAIATCQALIELGAHVNICTYYDQVTPLHIAVEKNFALLLELLLTNGGDLEARNVERDTPISLAIEHKHENIIEKIVEHVKRQKQKSRLDALKATEALLTPSKRGRPQQNVSVHSPYYVDLKRKTRALVVVEEVIEISDESDSEELDETQYYTPAERSSVNLFELTKENLEEFTKSNRVRNVQRRSLVSRWCDNIRRSDRPITMIDNIKRMANLFSGYGNDSTLQGEDAQVIEEDVDDEDQPREEKEEEEEEKEPESEIVPQEFIDLCVQEEKNEETVNEMVEQLVQKIPEIIITSPDQSVNESTLSKEIRSRYGNPTSDLTRSPPENQLWSEDEEEDVIECTLEERNLAKPMEPGIEVEDFEELPIIEISESHHPKDSRNSQVNQSTFDESNFIKSPKGDTNSIEQLVEEYEHRDIECGLKFFELKLVANNRYSSQSVNKLINLVENGQEKHLAPRPGSPDSTMSSIISTAISVPLDYDTDTLRDELKIFGVTAGPITRTTKRLYLRRLFRYKKDPRRVPANQFDAAVQYFSLELQQTLKPNLKDSVIQEYGKLEQQMELSFRGEVKNWRQGNAKKSFIYMLIDPRVSQNLPGLASGMEPHEIWRQFLASVFYVGKGKSSRPYAHLYEAMELNRRREQEVPKKMKDRAKVERILDIWKCDSGVVCLQVFHNIIPAEAFTREGAMIEALGVRSLTNLKSGEFYGIVQGWPQKKKKQLGIYLLFKALRMFLLEGESQISPADL